MRSLLKTNFDSQSLDNYVKIKLKDRNTHEWKMVRIFIKKKVKITCLSGSNIFYLLYYIAVENSFDILV